MVNYHVVFSLISATIGFVKAENLSNGIKSIFFSSFHFTNINEM